MAAPVMEYKAGIRRVYLPEGIWKSGLPGEIYNAGSSGRYVEEKAPLEYMSIFVR